MSDETAPQPKPEPELTIETELDHFAEYVRLFQLRDEEAMPE